MFRFMMTEKAWQKSVIKELKQEILELKCLSDIKPLEPKYEYNFLENVMMGFKTANLATGKELAKMVDSLSRRLAESEHKLRNLQPENDEYKAVIKNRTHEIALKIIEHGTGIFGIVQTTEKTEIHTGVLDYITAVFKTESKIREGKKEDE